MRKLFKTHSFNINIFEADEKMFIHLQSQHKVNHSTQNTLIKELKSDKSEKILEEMVNAFKEMLKGDKHV